MPGRETPSDWLSWALTPSAAPCNGDGDTESVAAPAREIPALLRRRAGLMGRAALHVLSAPEFEYPGCPVIFCSRYGELSRSLDLQHSLAAEGQVSPQHFSMAVHNAIGGLFMMARQAQAPLAALSAAEDTALAGLFEAQAQFADGVDMVWLLYCDESLPASYRTISGENSEYFAFVLELTAGDAFILYSAAAGEIPEDLPRAESPLGLLRFFLNGEMPHLGISRHGSWILSRNRGRGREDIQAGTQRIADNV